MTSWSNGTDDVMVMTTPSTSYDVVNRTNDYVISEEDKDRIVAISIIMACTLVGNLTLILILLCRRSRRIKRVNIFLINLAFGDLAVAIFVNSTEILFLAFGDWVLGAVMCKVMVYVQMVCLASATNLLTAMTLDRYQVIVKPMEALAKRPRILLKIAIAWAFSLVFPLPQLFIFIQYEGEKDHGTSKRICGSRGYTAPWQRKVYFTFTTAYILIVPMLIMLYCYAKIIHVVWVRANTDVLQQHQQHQQFHQQQQHDQQQQHHHPHHQQKLHRKKKSGRSDSSSEKKKSESAMIANKRADCPPKPKGERLPSDKDSTVIGSTDPTTEGHYNEQAVKTINSHQNNIKWAQGTRDRSPHPPSDNNKVSKCLDTKSKKGSNVSGRLSVRRNMMTSSKRRVLTMTLSVVMSFFICHTAYFVLSLVRIYSDYRIKMETAQIIGEFMVMVHSTLNPLLYGLFTLRQKHLMYLISLISCFRAKRRSGSTQLDNPKDEMHRLLRRPVSKTTVIQGSNHHSDVSTSSTGRVSVTPHRAGSPSSLSTSASSSSTSLKSSVLSRFRRKGKSSKSSSAEKEESSMGDSLLFSNTDALDLCTVSGRDRSSPSSKASPSKSNSAAVGSSSARKSSPLPARARRKHSSSHGVITVTKNSPVDRQSCDKKIGHNDAERSIVLANRASSLHTSVPASNGHSKTGRDKSHEMKTDINSEEEEEEEEEVIPPVDFNSVPWEDEFIIGGLTRV